MAHNQGQWYQIPVILFSEGFGRGGSCAKWSICDAVQEGRPLFGKLTFSWQILYIIGRMAQVVSTYSHGSDDRPCWDFCLTARHRHWGLMPLHCRERPYSLSTCHRGSCTIKKEAVFNRHLNLEEHSVRIEQAWDAANTGLYYTAACMLQLDLWGKALQ